jgi:hypothetical protein
MKYLCRKYKPSACRYLAESHIVRKDPNPPRQFRPDGVRCPAKATRNAAVDAGGLHLSDFFSSPHMIVSALTSLKAKPRLHRRAANRRRGRTITIPTPLPCARQKRWDDKGARLRGRASCGALQSETKGGNCGGLPGSGVVRSEYTPERPTLACASKILVRPRGLVTVPSTSLPSTSTATLCRALSASKALLGRRLHTES